MLAQERLNNLKKELDLVTLNTDTLNIEKIIDLSQQLDELIVKECRLRLKEYNSTSK